MCITVKRNFEQESVLLELNHVSISWYLICTASRYNIECYSPHLRENKYNDKGKKADGVFSFTDNTTVEFKNPKAITHKAMMY